MTVHYDKKIKLSEFDLTNHKYVEFDLTDFEYNNAPIKEKIEAKPHDPILDKLGLSILKPINNNEDYIYTYTSTDMFLNVLYHYDSIIGRSFYDLYPSAKPVFKKLFDKVMAEDVKEQINIALYKDKKIIVYMNIKILKHGKELYLITDNQTQSNLQIKRILDINSTINDVQKAASISIHYMTNRGNYVWTPETYQIIGRKPRKTDLNKNIILELASKEDQKKIKKLIDNLEPNTFLGGHELEITTESGEKKFLKIDTKKIYDDEGNFIQRTGYQRDITDDVLRIHELNSLSETVKDVQEAATISVHYQTPDEKYYWTPETYNIIGRKPRNSDEDIHIIIDLIENKKERKKILDEINKLKPNEFLGNRTITIKTEKNEEKFLNIDARKIYDEKGNLLRISGYAQDITDDVLRNIELTSLTATVTDVQTATSIAIYYKTPEGKYVWTQEVYNIMEREPEESDQHYHILLDLTTSEDRKKIIAAVNKLKPNEFLGEKQITIKTTNGKTKYLKMDAHKIYDENGELIQISGYAQDITQEILYTENLHGLNATMKDVQKATSMSIHYLNKEGKYIWSESTYDLIEREHRENDEDYNIILDLLTDEDKEKITTKIKNLKPNEFLGNYKLPITTENGKKKYIQYNTRPIYDKDGKFLRRSEYAMDISKQTEYENSLIRADEEKTILVKEVHHRVKNNLQLVASFINLEKRLHKDEPVRIMDITKKRIDSLALIHEQIYNENDMTSIHFKEYITKFDNIMLGLTSLENVKFSTVCLEDLILSVDIITPLSLIINELTTNSFKYAFSDEFKGTPKISKSLELKEINGESYYELIYKDNGKGLPKDFDIENLKSLGYTIIKSLIHQIDGKYKLKRGKGFCMKITFPAPP